MLRLGHRGLPPARAERHWPTALHGLLEAMSCALRCQGTIRGPFARWICEAELACPFGAGTIRGDVCRQSWPSDGDGHRQLFSPWTPELGTGGPTGGRGKTIRTLGPHRRETSGGVTSSSPHGTHVHIQGNEGPIGDVQANAPRVLCRDGGLHRGRDACGLCAWAVAGSAQGAHSTSLYTVVR